MHRRIFVPGALGAASLMLAIPASAAAHSPGAPGIGDPYYPAYGNGGYDVSHYDLRLKYQPATDRLEGTATILARTTADRSRFNLDFLLDVGEVRVNGAKASFTTSGEHELEITPKKPLDKGAPLTVVVRYSGVPSSKLAYGFTSWHRTPDGGVGAVKPGDPGPENQFDAAVYDRGALALQALRSEVGDEDFFAVLKGGAREARLRQRVGRGLPEVRRGGVGRAAGRAVRHLAVPAVEAGRADGAHRVAREDVRGVQGVRGPRAAPLVAEDRRDERRARALSRGPS